MLLFKSSKAQLITADFLIAVVILILIIQTSVSLWNRIVNSLRVRETRTEMENLALAISDLLVKSSGLPGDWNSTDVITIGLAGEDNVLDPGKVSSFTGLDSDTTKELLGIKNFEFLFRLKNTDGGDLIPPHNSTESIPANAEVVNIRRLVLYDGNRAYMDFGLLK